MLPAVQFHHVSKAYRLGESAVGMGEWLRRSARRLTGRNTQKKETLWALHDISFELAKGQALGLIGPNGAGKSTALKLLAKITQPTSGRIETNGRIAALIELGAGFHLDLTGRENTFLNAAILGMPLKKANRLFDQIVAFAGLEKFIDTPLKRYSSGMQVRLGFAIAAHVEPEILLVDEVLAVGDSQFRQKCIQRIEELQKAGTTIIFVSHNLYMVKSVCDLGLFIKEGKVGALGPVVEAINAYEDWFHQSQSEERQKELKKKGRPLEASAVDITRILLKEPAGGKTDNFQSNEPLEIAVHYRAHQPIPTPNLALFFVRADGITATMIRLADYGYQLDDLIGEGVISVTIDPLQLAGGAYVVEAGILGGFDVPLSRGHSQWFQVDGLSFSSRQRSGVFVPKIASAKTIPL